MLSSGRFMILLAVLLAVPAGASEEADAWEPLRWLSAYLQIDTTNPPGNEDAAADFLAGLLGEHGIESRRLTSPTGRTSLYARISPGGVSQDGLSEEDGGDRRAIALIHHMDVVPAGDGWTVEPFSGRPLDGRVWGRGAIDTKGLGIAQLAALLACRDELTYDVVYLAVADEERGGGQGAGWLVEAHPELFEGLDGVLNEGGFNRVYGGRVLWWGIEVTQKRPLWLRVKTHGRGGHASGFHPGSATHQLVVALARVVQRPLQFRVSPAARRFASLLAEVEGGATADFARHMDERVAAGEVPSGLPLYFIDTVQVTAIDTGETSNVVVPKAEASIDVRLLPDTDADAFLEEIRELVGGNVEVEVVLASGAAAPSPEDHPLYRAVEEVLAVRGKVVPAMIAGVTDSRFFRERGIPAYGFMPFVVEPQDMKGIHAADERIPEDAFLRGVETLRRVLLAYSRTSL